jgi:hypothetical protein
VPVAPPSTQRLWAAARRCHSHPQLCNYIHKYNIRHSTHFGPTAERWEGMKQINRHSIGHRAQEAGLLDPVVVAHMWTCGPARSQNEQMARVQLRILLLSCMCALITAMPSSNLLARWPQSKAGCTAGCVRQRTRGSLKPRQNGQSSCK